MSDKQGEGDLRIPQWTINSEMAAFKEACAVLGRLLETDADRQLVARFIRQTWWTAQFVGYRLGMPGQDNQSATGAAMLRSVMVDRDEYVRKYILGVGSADPER